MKTELIMKFEYPEPTESNPLATGVIDVPITIYRLEVQRR